MSEAKERDEAYRAERKRAREAKRAKAKAAYEAGKHKYATYEEYVVACRERQKAYVEARKAGTWVRKNRIHSERVARNAGLPVGYDPNDPTTWGKAPPPKPVIAPARTASVQQQGMGAEAHPHEIEDWDEIVMPYLGSRDDEANRTKGRKLTPEEKRAAKTEWQRRYRELKRLAAGKPKRTRRKFKSEEEAKEAARAYRRAYGKKYRALKKSGEWVPRSERRPADAAVATPVEPKKKGGRRSQFATEEERRAAKNEYNRKYHLLRKTGLWVRKNRVFSERVAKSAGVLTEKERIAQAMSFPAKRLFGSEADWKAAIDAKCKRAPMTKKEREERRRLIKEKYGFDIWTPVKKLTLEELEGRKRWLRDEEAEYRNRNREHITNYNREYRQRKRAEALAIKQRTWTAEEWAAWEKKEAAKGRGKPEQFVKEVVKVLAGSGKISEDQVMDHLLEHGGVEFLMSGAEAIGKDRARLPKMVKAAAMAVAFYVDPDGAVMFPEA